MQTAQKGSNTAFQGVLLKFGAIIIPIFGAVTRIKC